MIISIMEIDHQVHQVHNVFMQGTKKSLEWLRLSSGYDKNRCLIDKLTDLLYQFETCKMGLGLAHINNCIAAHVLIEGDFFIIKLMKAAAVGI